MFTKGQSGILDHSGVLDPSGNCWPVIASHIEVPAPGEAVCTRPQTHLTRAPAPSYDHPDSPLSTPGTVATAAPGTTAPHGASTREGWVASCSHRAQWGLWVSPAKGLGAAVICLTKLTNMIYFCHGTASCHPSIQRTGLS
jgi:hypothetical protein